MKDRCSWIELLNSTGVLSKILATKPMGNRRNWVEGWLKSCIIDEKTVQIWEDEGLIPLEVVNNAQILYSPV